MQHEHYSTKKILWLLCVFAISMAYLETAVVIYLRELYYPEGFRFPLKILPLKQVWIELGREASTLALLAVIGMMAGRNRWTRFACFMFTFGVWDIFYYFWLKALIDWPSSLVEWDILFLIPVPWTGPVLAPMIVALSMIAASMTILAVEDKERPFSAKRHELIVVALGAFIILFSFMANFEIVVNEGIPKVFRWEIFWTGEVIGLYFFSRAVFRNNTYN